MPNNILTVILGNNKRHSKALDSHKRFFKKEGRMRGRKRRKVGEGERLVIMTGYN